MSGGKENHPALKPCAGKQIWDLGHEKNWPHLGNLLKTPGVESLWVTSAGAEARLSYLRREFDSSRNPKNCQGIVGVLCGGGGGGGDRGHQLLRRVLALGADPDVPGKGGLRPLHLASSKLLVRCVEAVTACRPDYSAKASSGRFPLDCSPSARRHVGGSMNQQDSIDAHARIQLIWSDLLLVGFPSIAELASRKDFWAVKNLCRRRVVTNDEVGRVHDGRDVFQWVNFYGEHKLSQELRYLLGGPILENLMRDVALLTKRVAALETRSPAKAYEVVAAGSGTNECHEKPDCGNGGQCEMKKDSTVNSSGYVLENKAIVRRLDAFRTDQEGKIEELQVAFAELAAELREVEARLEVRGNRVEDPESEADGRSTRGEDPSTSVVSGLLTRIEGIAASGRSDDLVEDLLILVEKHGKEKEADLIEL